MNATTVYKLTRPDLTTYNGFQWTLLETQRFPGTGPLCTAGWAHAYESPELAVLLNPIHAAYDPFLLFEARGVVGATDNGLKVGCSELTLMRRIDPPQFSLNQIVAFGIYCALAVGPDKTWNQWAKRWLSGEDRSREAAAMAAAYVARDAAWAAQDSAMAAAMAAAYVARDATLDFPTIIQQARRIS